MLKVLRQPHFLQCNVSGCFIIMQKEVYYSDDYAGIDADNLKFYYGYEVVKKVEYEEEWCFQVKKDGKEIFKATTTDIEKSVKECPFRDVRDYLLAGISMWLLSK